MTARRMFRYAVPVDDQAHVIRLTDGPVRAVTAIRGLTAGSFVEFWAEHAEGAPVTARAFRVFGTGHPLPDGAEWAGTCPRTRDGLVWHLFEVPAGDGFFPGGDPRDDDWTGGYRPGIEGD